MSHRAAALASLLNRPLAMERATLEAMLAALTATTELGGRQAAGQPHSRRPDAPAVGVLPLNGHITYRPSILSAIFGGGAETALVEWVPSLVHLKHKSGVESIVIPIWSGGGGITGVEEAAYELRETRKIKPVLALVDCFCCSAAYWLAAQATEIVITPSGEVGSVGVYQLHVEESQLLANTGITPTYIAAGKYKTEGNPLEPLSDEAHREIQRSVDSAHATFVADIVKGRGRGLTPDHVKKEFGQGRVLEAADAIRRGMVDRLFPTPAAAFGYAVHGFNDARQRRADLDHMDFVLYAHGGPAERTAAMARLRARQGDPAAQRQADVDYIDTGIKIAQRR